MVRDRLVLGAGKRMKVAAKTVCDRFKSKIRLLQLYRDGSETVWLLDLIALDADSALIRCFSLKIVNAVGSREIQA